MKSHTAEQARISFATSIWNVPARRDDNDWLRDEEIEELSANKIELILKGYPSAEDAVEIVDHLVDMFFELGVSLDIWDESVTLLKVQVPSAMSARECHYNRRAYCMRRAHIAAKSAILATDQISQALNRLSKTDARIGASFQQMSVRYPDLTDQRDAVAHSLERRRRRLSAGGRGRASLPTRSAGTLLSDLIAWQGYVDDDTFVVAVGANQQMRPSAFDMTDATWKSVGEIIQHAFDAVAVEGFKPRCWSFE